MRRNEVVYCQANVACTAPFVICLFCHARLGILAYCLPLSGAYTLVDYSINFDMEILRFHFPFSFLCLLLHVRCFTTQTVVAADYIRHCGVCFDRQFSVVSTGCWTR